MIHQNQKKKSASASTVTTTSDGREKRGPTELNRIRKVKKKRKLLEVEFNNKGQPHGKVAKLLASYTGVMVRIIVPISNNTWFEMDSHYKEKLWTEITVILVFD